MQEKSLEELLKILACGDDNAREAAALELGQLKAAAIEPLAAMLAQAEPPEGCDARWWAARALAETGEEAATTLLIHALADADPDVRACAALALGQIGSGAAAPALAARQTRLGCVRRPIDSVDLRVHQKPRPARRLAWPRLDLASARSQVVRNAPRSRVDRLP